jgi:hypothetical protein
LFCVSFDSSRAKTQAGRLASLPASQDVSSFFTARCESSPRFRSRSPASFCKLARFWCAHRNAPFPVASPFPRRFLPSSRFLFGVRLHGPRDQVASCRSICSQVAATAPRFCFPAHFLAHRKEPATSGVHRRFPSAWAKQIFQLAFCSVRALSFLRFPARLLPGSVCY